MRCLTLTHKTLLFNDYQCGSTLENIEDWRWKLTMLVRNNDEQEVVSRERKDRRDFEQLSSLATRMGLHRFINYLVYSIIFLLFFI